MVNWILRTKCCWQVDVPLRQLKPYRELPCIDVTVPNRVVSVIVGLGRIAATGTNLVVVTGSFKLSLSVET